MKNPNLNIRQNVMSKYGLVASSQPLASMAGIQILMAGGNAADAAVAIAAALGVTEPTSSGLGGDMFALYYDSSTKIVSALNGSGRSPAALTLELIRRKMLVGHDNMISDPFHPLTVTVPGACAGWNELLKKFGSLPLNKVLEPAIKLAEQGFPVAPITAYFWNQGVERQQMHTRGRALTINGRSPKAGEIFKNPELANTLRVIAEGGADAFYQGEIAKQIVSSIQRYGGVLDLEDMNSHASAWENPISTTYRNVKVWECPPNGQGLTALIALNLLEGYDMNDLTPRSVDRLHIMIEAFRIAFSDTRWYVSDPIYGDIPLKGLLSKGYATKRRQLIKPDRATLDTKNGSPFESSDTVYFCVVDHLGNACSFINSNYMGFGTGIVPSGLGFPIQNRGHHFSLDPNHPNSVAPLKRVYHTIMPGMITLNDNSLYGAFGIMGGFMQPQGHVQFLIGLIDDQLDPQSVIEQPRFCLEPGQSNGRVALEEGIEEETLQELKRRGHDAYIVSGMSRSVFGRGQIILRDVHGVLVGGSDSRADGCAIGI